MPDQDALQSQLNQGDLLRRQGRWAEAALAYERELQRTALPAAALNLALCHFALDRFEAAAALALRVPVTDPNHWRSVIIHARAQVALDRIDPALAALTAHLARHPEQVKVALERADVLLHQVGDAAAARHCVEAFLDHPEHGEAAQQTFIVASLYDREESTADLVARIKRLSSGFPRSQNRKAPVFPRTQSDRKRVGLISGNFSVSPVYFLTYGVLKELATHVDLIFHDRGSKKDWAYQRFRDLSHEWVDVDQATPGKLSEVLHAGHLDVLVDMAGWADVDVLRALADKPAPRMYKWVGGQSATTGLEQFDGFISDEIQTPPATQNLYSEKLLNLPAGYVSYTPPEYLPKAVPARGDLLLLGVIGNPVKVSREFARVLGERLLTAAKTLEVPIALQFIDGKYRHASVRERISELLRPTLGTSNNVAVLFTQPRSHRDFLERVGKLSAVLDTRPYSAGLTALEALSLGVPLLGLPGTLCSERHAASHQHYALNNAAMQDFSLANLRKIQRNAGKKRTAITATRSRRARHQDVAAEILNLINQ